MVSTSLALLGAAILTASPAPARRVAVLDFNASWARGCADVSNAGDAQRERCEILRALADQARIGALAVLRPPGYVVMTRENTAQILKEMGGQCADGECEVETARMLGASVVVSGEVMLLEGTWVVSLKVHDVGSAALLGGGKTKGKSKLEALENVQAETERMLRAAVGLEGGATAPAVATPAPAPEQAAPSADVAEATPPVAEAPRAAPAGVERSDARRWWVEAAYGIPLMQTASRLKMTTNDASKVYTGMSMRLGAGYQWRPTLGFEVNLMASQAPGFESTDAVPRRVEFDHQGAGVGAVWRPKANPWFTVALGAGLGQAKVWIWATGVPDQTFGSSTAPWFYGELRGEYPIIDALLVGARIGFLRLNNGETVTSVNGSTGATNTLGAGGSFTIVPISASVKYRF